MVVRLALAAVIAGLGAVLVLVGIRGVGVTGTADASPAVSSAVSPPASRPAPTTQPAVDPLLAPSATPTVRDAELVGAGDIGRCDTDADEATAALVERLPGLVFTLGDNAYDSGSVAEFRDCLGPSWGRFRDRIGLPVPGNHDHKTDGAAGYLGWFGAAAAPEGVTWYARDVGSWRVIVLDSTCDSIGGCGPDSAQGRWLAEELDRGSARCTLALFHHPRFSSGYHGSDDDVAPFWDALHAAGADLVLNGHEHSYERFAPQAPDGGADEERGITQLVVGTGGAELRGFGEPVANSRVRSSLAHGVLSLTLRPSGWAYRFESVDGSFTDEGAGTCH